MTPLPALRHLWLLHLFCLICVVVECALLMGDWGWLPVPRLRNTVYEYTAFWPGLLGPWTPNYASQPYLMFLSYAFLHSGLQHLGLNLIGLYSLGPMVTERVGQGGLALLFALTVLGGALGYGLLSNGPAPMVGASGGLFGLAGGILAWNYVDRFSTARRLWPVLVIVLGLIALNGLQWYMMGGHLAWETHLGGFVTGWIAALLIDPRSHSLSEPPPDRHKDTPPDTKPTSPSEPPETP